MKQKQATYAEEWQLAVLHKLHSESDTPTEEQRAAVVAETGLDEKWVRNWFRRQRLKSRTAPRSGRIQVVPSERETHPVNLSPKILPTFRLQVSSANDEPHQPPRTLPSYRSTSAPIDPIRPFVQSPRQPSPASVGSYSPRSSGPILHAQGNSQRRISGPSTYQNVSSPDTTPLPRTTAVTTYPRDPLCDRYPDFSQFFHPQVHERFRDSGSEAPINGHSLLMQLLANADMDPHAPPHLQGLLNTPHLGSIRVDQPASTCPRPFPIAFSVRLVDLMD